VEQRFSWFKQYGIVIAGADVTGTPELTARFKHVNNQAHTKRCR
jgi:hypothetical protein